MSIKIYKMGEIIITCPWCKQVLADCDCPDMFANESDSAFKEQEKILKKLQESGINVVTCGDCGQTILVKKETDEK